MKGNRPCPGYDTDLRIHDEGTKLRKRFGQNDLPVPVIEYDSASPATSTTTTTTTSSSQSHSTGSPPEDLTDFSQTTTPDWEVIEGVAVQRAESLLPAYNVFFHFLESEISPDVVLDRNGLLSGGSIIMNTPFALTMNTPLQSPYLAQEQLLSTFSSAIGSAGVVVLPREMQNHHRWLSNLPTYFGTKLLDAAIRAVSMVHLGRITGSDQFVHESRQFYGQALRLLNKALADPEKGMASETLSATVLLSFYEMFASNSNQAWLRHAGGAGALMQLRGPGRHRYGLDRDVYLAYRHTIMIEAFQRDEDCFLAKPEWREMARQVHEDLRVGGISEERREIFDLAEEFYEEYIQIPTTFKEARALPAAKQTMSREDFQVHAQNILERAQQYRYRMKLINVRFRAALQATGLETTTAMTNDKVFPLQYVYVNVFIGSTNVGYWTIMILLNIVLKEAEKPTHPERTGLYIMENHEIAMEICRSTPFMLTSSFLGPFFITFALRLCLLIFEPGDQRSWVVEKLTEIGTTRISMASDIPEFEAPSTVAKVIRKTPAELDWL